MRSLGRIVRLQIQRSTLKPGEKPTRGYDPAPILAVPRLAVGPDGVLGEGPDGSWLVDVHHRAHPHTKNEDGAHGVSLGFTSHYALMQQRFGDRIVPGCAGENVLVDSEERVTLDDLNSGVAVLGTDGRELVCLDVLQVAHPCRPFSGWALGGMVETDVLKATLQFLDEGVLLRRSRDGDCLGRRPGGGPAFSLVHPTPIPPSSCTVHTSGPSSPPRTPGGGGSSGTPRTSAGRCGPRAESRAARTARCSTAPGDDSGSRGSAGRPARCAGSRRARRCGSRRYGPPGTMRRGAGDGRRACRPWPSPSPEGASA